MSAPIKLEVNGDVYADDFKKSLDALSKATNKSAATLVRDRASMMARYLAAWTMPVYGLNSGNPDGESKQTQWRFEKKIARDIGRVYVDARKVTKSLKQIDSSRKSMARLFYHSCKRMDLGDAKTVIQNTRFANLDVMKWDNGQLHQQSRYDGKIAKHRRPKIVIDPQQIEKYKKKQMKNAGFTKASWVNAGRQVNGKVSKEVLHWVKRHSNAPANGTFIKKLAIAEARLTSNVPWVSKKIDDRKAMNAFDKNMRKDIINTLRAIAESEQRKK